MLSNPMFPHPLSTSLRRVCPRTVMSARWRRGISCSSPMPRIHKPIFALHRSHPCPQAKRHDILADTKYMIAYVGLRLLSASVMIRESHRVAVRSTLDCIDEYASYLGELECRGMDPESQDSRGDAFRGKRLDSFPVDSSVLLRAGVSALPPPGGSTIAAWAR